MYTRRKLGKTMQADRLEHTRAVRSNMGISLCNFTIIKSEDIYMYLYLDFNPAFHIYN